MILFVDPDWRERKDYMAKIEEIRDVLGEGNLRAVERPPEYRGFKVFRQSIYPDLSELLKNRTSPRVIHSMGYFLSYSAIGAKKECFPSLRIHADMRDVLPEECLFYEEGILNAGD
ncbi:hypothetical protein JW926_17760 [Candidatus Sumerlaeota bacterium]|nr:hypothetical protein [Candidatus Sumerlaeota bacterium]